MHGLVLAEIARALGMSEEAVLLAERNGDLFSVVWPDRNDAHVYPVFQTWPEMGVAAGSVTSPLANVLHALGAPQTGGSSLFGFFSSHNDLLGGTTPVEVLAGRRVTASRALDCEVIDLLDAPSARRLEAVLSAAGAYAADLAA